MTKIGEALQLTQSLYSKGVQSKDSRLSPRQVYAETIIARSVILRQQIGKHQIVNEWSYQILPCVELIKALPYECPCVPSNGCSILRTKYKLPTPIGGLDDMLIRSVTTLDGGEKIDLTSFEQVKYDNGKKYTSTKSGYYIRNQYAFITHKEQLKGLSMDGLFDDPIEVHNFPSLCGLCEDCECLDIMDYDFPADKNALKGICQLAANRLIIMFGQMKEDKIGNASDDIVMGNQMIHQPNDNTGE